MTIEEVKAEIIRRAENELKIREARNNLLSFISENSSSIGVFNSSAIKSSFVL